MSSTKEITAACILLDMSGSMGSLKEGTLKSINNFILENKQNNQENNTETIFSLYTFSTTNKVDIHAANIVYNLLNIEDIPEFTEEHYHPTGMTGLYDAEYYSITDFSTKLDSRSEEDTPDKVVFVVITDGEENASQTHTNVDVKTLIKDKEDNHNWKFAFLGANQDSFRESQQMGIGGHATLNYIATDEGICSALRSISKEISQYQRNESIEINFTQEDRELNNTQ